MTAGCYETQIWASHVHGLADLPDLAAAADGLAAESDIDYEGIQPTAPPTMPDLQTVARKSAYCAHKGEWRMAYRANTPSPSADPRLDDSKHALISLNPQSLPRSLTAADVANEPGTPPLRVTTTRDVGEACGKVPRPLVEVGILFRGGYHCDSQARGRAAGV